MSHKDVQSSISSVVPCAHLAWPVGKAPGLPWAVYYLDDESGFFADDRRYAPVSNWVVELYQAVRDERIEEALQCAIEENFGPYTKSEYWVESEKCFQTTYRFTQI